MRLIKRMICDKDMEGSVVLCCEQPEDCWHAYNLIHVGDHVRSATVRKIAKERSGSVSNEKKRLTLNLEVENIEFDPISCLIRINGKVIEENRFVRMGAYHSLELELNRNFTLYKSCWDTISLERLETCCDIMKQADVAAIVMQPGLANLCLITSHMTVPKAKIEVSIPKKRREVSGYDRAIQRFFEGCLQAIFNHVDFSVVKCLIIASPGFLHQDFRKYLCDQVTKPDRDRSAAVIADNLNKLLLTHSSSGHKHSIREILSNPAIQEQLCDTKASSEVAALNEFFRVLGTDSDRATYGYKEVAQANEHLAIDSLLLSDSLFRSTDINVRRRYIDLVESVRSNRGIVHIFSSLHVSGEQLDNISGIAALLRFPLSGMDINYENEEEEDSETDYSD